MRNIINKNCFCGNMYNLVYDSETKEFFIYDEEKPDFYGKGFTSIEAIFHCLKSEELSQKLYNRILSDIKETGNINLLALYTKGI